MHAWKSQFWQILCVSGIVAVATAGVAGKVGAESSLAHNYLYSSPAGMAALRLVQERFTSDRNSRHPFSHHRHGRRDNRLFKRTYGPHWTRNTGHSYNNPWQWVRWAGCGCIASGHFPMRGTISGSRVEVDF